MSSGEHPLSDAVDAWYSEEGDYAPYYGQEGPYSHFTQVVWVGSTKLGCYTSHCPTLTDPENPGSPMSGYFTACNYLEAGKIFFF